jgi:hypothetical protein
MTSAWMIATRENVRNYRNCQKIPWMSVAGSWAISFIPSMPHGPTRTDVAHAGWQLVHGLIELIEVMTEGEVEAGSQTG